MLIWELDSIHRKLNLQIDHIRFSWLNMICDEISTINIQAITMKIHRKMSFSTCMEQNIPGGSITIPRTLLTNAKVPPINSFQVA